MTNYVLGFLFTKFGQVALIRKNKPEWQRGLLNGIGGKVELNESPIEAMIREFKEETGVDTSNCGWRYFAKMQGDGFIVDCFTSTNTDAAMKITSQEDEEACLYSHDTLHGLSTVSNLGWLIEMALDQNYGKPFYATIEYIK